MLRRLVSFALTLSLSFVIFGCGGSSDSNAPPPIVITSISEVGTIETGDAIDLVANGDYLYYIGWGNTSSSFGIIDFSDPANPAVLSTLDAGSAYGVAFDGRYAYVETDGGGSGIFTNGTVGVIDCQDPNNPVEADENNLGYSSAYDMEISGNYLYNFSWNIIGVYDISDPTNLTHVANVPSSAAIFGKIVGNYLYLGSYYNGLEIYDISNPTGLTGSTTPVGTLAIPGTPGYAAAASGTTAFIAGTDGGLNYIHSVDVSDPANPVLISSVETSTFIDYEMRVLGNYLLASGDSEFVVIDISDPTAMTVVGSVPLTNNGFGFDVSGRYAIVGDDTLFRIIQLY